MYCLQACLCTLFSAEVLQAGAVKGLIALGRRDAFHRGHDMQHGPESLR